MPDAVGTGTDDDDDDVTEDEDEDEDSDETVETAAGGGFSMVSRSRPVLPKTFGTKGRGRAPVARSGPAGLLFAKRRPATSRDRAIRVVSQCSRLM